MTPALLFIVAISLGFCGLVAMLCGLIGQPTLERPSCRACRRDVREAAWSSQPTCVCGARLDGARAVRWSGRQRSRGAIVAGIALIALAAGAVQAEWTLRARQLQWQDLLPASYLIGKVRRNEELDANLRALARRADVEWLGADDRRGALEALLSLQAANTPVGDLSQRLVLYQRLLAHPTLMGPEDEDLRTRVLAASDVLLGWQGPPTFDRSEGAGDVVPFAWPQGIGPAIIVIEEILVNDRPLPYRVVLGGRGNETRVWTIPTKPTTGAAGEDELAWLQSVPKGERRYRLRATEYHVPLVARWTLSIVLGETGVIPEGVLHTKRESEWSDPPASEAPSKPAQNAPQRDTKGGA